MARRPPAPKPVTPPADLSPFEVGDDDDEVAGGGIPDDDGWIHLDSTKEEPREDEKPKRKPARRRA